MISHAVVRHLVSIVAGLCLLLFLFGASAVAGDMVPLKGNFEGVGSDFAGKFTHLGKFSGVFNPVTLTAEWTAANGDTVTNQTIAFTPMEEVAPGVFLYEQSLLITGGTGRFANATGFAEVVGLINFATGGFDGDVDGRISRPNSRR